MTYLIGVGRGILGPGMVGYHPRICSQNGFSAEPSPTWRVPAEGKGTFQRKDFSLPSLNPSSAVPSFIFVVKMFLFSSRLEKNYP